MGKNQKKKESEKNKTIEDLKKEFKDNEEIRKKNKEQYKLQVQMGMIKKGLPPNQMYDTLLQTIEGDIKELKMKLDTKFETINPVFQFQSMPEWGALQIEQAEKKLKQQNENIKEIKARVSEVKADVAEQNSRIEQRQPQIIEQLKKLKADISDVKIPNYIG